MLGSLLKKQPAFGYHQAMYRAVLTLLVGLMLLLGGGASALTFKSDGSVVQSDGKVLKQASPSDEGDDFVCKNATVVQLGKNILGLSLSGKHVWRGRSFW